MAVGDEIPEALGAHYCEPDDLPEAAGILDELAAASGLPRPTLWLWDVAEPNAMATGEGPDTATVTVTSGLLDALDGRELRAVLAHEVGHIAAGDVAEATAMARRAAMGVGALGAGAGIAGLGALATDTPLDDLLALVGGATLTTVAARRASARLAGFSRKRELAADAFAVQAGGAPYYLASALARIDAGSRRVRQVPGWARLLLTVDNQDHATHPPVEQRIASLGASTARPPSTRTCARCRYGEVPRASSCSRCGAALPDLTCACGGPIDLEDRFCPTCHRPSPAPPCRRCGRSLDGGAQHCGVCGQPQDPAAAAVPMASLARRFRRRAWSFTLTRSTQRQLRAALAAHLAPGEEVLEAVEARSGTGWGATDGLLVVTDRQLVFIRRGLFRDQPQWRLGRDEILTVSIEADGRSSALVFGVVDGEVAVGGIAPAELAAGLRDLLVP